MSTVAEPRPQPQNNPDRLDPPQAPAAQTTPRAPPTEEEIAAAAAPAALDHAHDQEYHRHVLAHGHGHATVQQHPESLQPDSVVHHHHPHHHPHHSQLHHHAEGGPTQALARHDLEAANMAHFDALGFDFDRRHPFAAIFADRLARALLSQTQTRSASGSGSGGGGSSSLVLDEDATSVLDYACGSGM